MSVLTAERMHVALGARTIVADASLALRGGELTILLGPNGAGKTTLMRALAGLVPFTGRVRLQSEDLTAVPARQRARRIAYLPQGHQFFWPVSVADCVALGREPHADFFARRSRSDERQIAWAMEMTETADLAARSVTTLSGGERARVALARALATDAPILLADEPAAGLDPRHQLVLLHLLRQLAAEGRTILAILHDLTLAARFADRLLVMDRGRIVADGPAGTVMSPALLADVFGVEAEKVALAGAEIMVPVRPRRDP